ncbi:tyrosine-protein kinase Fer-like [Aedes aegypti]|uniref:Uncharacterized protein n=1 Tax=Aedes aegypti TaxID=7159 RepID=A0A903VC26_AEDAE|nr:tyrosine-protein kinase Fer-like [Aedes aegypti]
MTEDVARKKSEYQKHLEYYKMLRGRFEEIIKSGRSGRKLDDVIDKYQKACRKLHLAHNEYVLLLSEAAEIEKGHPHHPNAPDYWSTSSPNRRHSFSRGVISCRTCPNWVTSHRTSTAKSSSG